MNHDTCTTAVILCGGLGTRLRGAIPADRPKALARIHGRPFLDYLLDQIVDAAIARRAVLCTGWLGDAIREVYGERYRGLDLVYSSEAEPLGTGGAVQNALAHVETDDFVVFNGDSFADVDLRTFLRWSRGRGARLSLVSVEVRNMARFGGIRLGSANRVLSFAEKDPAGARRAGWIHAGVLFVSRTHAVESWPRARAWSLETDLLAVRKDVLAWPQHRRFLDIGTPASLERAQSFFAPRSERAARGLLVLDRDGTLIEDVPYLNDPAKVRLLPGVVEGLKQARAAGYDLAVVTNQSGVGRGHIAPGTLERIHARLEELLAEHGVRLDGIWHCPHRPEDACACRKPEPRLLLEACRVLGHEPTSCVVVGDKPCDVRLAERAGARESVLVRTGHGAETASSGVCAPGRVLAGLDEIGEVLEPRVVLEPFRVGEPAVVAAAE